MSTPTLQLAMAILDMKWGEMTEFAEFIRTIATDDNRKPNDPYYIARCLHAHAEAAVSKEPTR